MAEVYYASNMPPGWLLGDNGYPLLPYLLTPFLRPQGGQQERYRITRSTVERALGVWKHRFRCIHKSGGCMMYWPVRCSRIIFAVAILHNICVRRNLPLLVEDGQDADNDGDVVEEQQGRGVEVRQRIATQF